MPERSDAPEGWGVRQRLPVLVALATLTALILLLVAADTLYKRSLKPEVYRPYATFPGPGVETFIHDGDNDPHVPARRHRSDPSLEAAKRDIVRSGLPGWKPHP